MTKTKLIFLILIILILIFLVFSFIYWLKQMKTETEITPETEPETLMPVEPSLPMELPPLAE